MSRILLVLLMLAATAGAVVAYGDPGRIARAGDTVSDLLRKRSQPPARAVQIARGPERRIRAASQDQRRQRADGDRYRRDLGRADL